MCHFGSSSCNNVRVAPLLFTLYRNSIFKWNFNSYLWLDRGRTANQRNNSFDRLFFCLFLISFKRTTVTTANTIQHSERVCLPLAIVYSFPMSKQWHTVCIYLLWKSITLLFEKPCAIYRICTESDRYCVPPVLCMFFPFVVVRHCLCKVDA